ncbi:hypothetical protein OSTOST_21591, partial [Ostertagia ostertagi]
TEASHLRKRKKLLPGRKISSDTKSRESAERSKESMERSKESLDRSKESIDRSKESVDRSKESIGRTAVRRIKSEDGRRNNKPDSTVQVRKKGSKREADNETGGDGLYEDVVINDGNDSVFIPQFK